MARAPAADDGRERPWRAAGRTLMVDAAAGGRSTPAARAAEGATLSGVMDRDRAAALAWLGDRDPAWSEVAVYRRLRLRVTADEAEALQRAIAELLEPYGTDVRAPAEGTREVRVALMLAPTA